jgi:hypothetical protein
MTGTLQWVTYFLVAQLYTDKVFKYVGILLETLSVRAI